MNNRPLRTVLLAASFMAVMAGGLSLVHAHSGMTGIVKTRMELMMDVGRQMKTVGEMLKGTAAFDHAAIGVAARRIGTHAEKIGELFPEGSLDQPTEASPAIWQDWEGFLSQARNLELASAELATIGAEASRQEVATKFSAVGRTCSGCHEAFRVKK